jgi:hypothetical protein
MGIMSPEKPKNHPDKNMTDKLEYLLVDIRHNPRKYERQVAGMRSRPYGQVFLDPTIGSYF